MKTTEQYDTFTGVTRGAIEVLYRYLAEKISERTGIWLKRLFGMTVLLIPKSSEFRIYLCCRTFRCRIGTVANKRLLGHVSVGKSGTSCDEHRKS